MSAGAPARAADLAEARRRLARSMAYEGTENVSAADGYGLLAGVGMEQARAQIRGASVCRDVDHGLRAPVERGTGGRGAGVGHVEERELARASRLEQKKKPPGWGLFRPAFGQLSISSSPCS